MMETSMDVTDVILMLHDIMGVVLIDATYS
jgi:hypothetical protein